MYLKCQQFSYRYYHEGAISKAIEDWRDDRPKYDAYVELLYLLGKAPTQLTDKMELVSLHSFSKTNSYLFCLK